MDNLQPSDQFLPVLEQIQQARQKAYSQVNAVLVELYWHIGQYIHHQINDQGWGKAVVAQLAQYILHNEPTDKGFGDKNLWWMKQFYETYADQEKLATLWRQISWSRGNDEL